MYTEIEEHQITTETVESIGQFAILWGMFEEKYFDRCCTSAKLKKLQVIKYTEPLIHMTNCIKDALLSLYLSPEETLKRLCIRNNEKDLIEIILSIFDDDACAESKIYASICICFRIRNNSFHGEKVFWTLNNQREIIDSCSSFLNCLLREDEVFQVLA